MTPTAARGAGRRARPWIVKLGGSLADAVELPAWLEALASGGGRIILVPGGGPFADAVREAQRRWGFADGIAHRLAIMAMEQYAWMLSGLRPELRPAATASGLRRILRQDGVPLWLPGRMALGRSEIPESWDVTSDSLAAWLGGEIGAVGVVLVKSVGVPRGCTVDSLAARGVVDPLLPGFLRRAGLACRCIAAAEHAAMRAALGAGGMAGTPVVTVLGEPE